MYFRSTLQATIPQIGGDQGRFERRDRGGIAYGYQAKPSTRRPVLPDRSARTADLVASATKRAS